MTTEFGMLAHWWNGSLEQVQGTLCSRKFNGWSALWDGGVTQGMLASDIPWYYKGGDKRPLLSTGLWSLGRNNKPKVLPAPKYFTEKLPIGVPVHGELWYNDRLDIVKRTVGTKKYYNPMWYNIKFMAFHIKPYSLWTGMDKFIDFKDLKNDSIINSSLIILESLTLRDIIGDMGYLHQFKNDIFDVIKINKIYSEEDLKNWQRHCIEHSWEGLMFAKPDSKYECKRSWNNLKWKQEYETEAVVYGYEDGKTGKNIGKVGALKATLIWDNQIMSIYGGSPRMVGKEADFCIGGLNDHEREWGNCKQIYPVGTKIKFKFSGVSVHGVPQSCNIHR